ncbi:hypothetical protein [Streptomyces phaeofaciens]|uniref:hypothetical protein n=1 Tax=Streptomyces phaeofaciens TaxID=68254 RepID=UPI003679B913
MLFSPDRRRRHQHQPWVDDVWARLKTLDIRPLRAVIPPTGYVPDFLTPAPGTGPANVAEELAVVRETPLEHFVGEVAWMANDPGTPADWRREAAPLHRRMLDEPAWAIARITQLLDAYWKLALSGSSTTSVPCWPTPAGPGVPRRSGSPPRRPPGSWSRSPARGARTRTGSPSTSSRSRAPR